MTKRTCIEKCTFLYTTKRNDKVMDTPSFKEDHISQIPALQILDNLDFMCLINQNLHNKVDSFSMQKDKI